MTKNPLFFLALAACGGPINSDGVTDGHDLDDSGGGNTGNETINGVTFTAANGEYDFQGDSVKLLAEQKDQPGVQIQVLDEEGDSVTLEDEDGNVLTETVAVVYNLKPGSYTTLFDYVDEDGISSIGQVDGNVTKAGDEVKATLCDDKFAGDWHFTYEDDGTDAFDSHGVEMNGCSTQMDNIAAGNEWLNVVYNYASYDDYDIILDRATDSLRVHDKVYDVWFTGVRD